MLENHKIVECSQYKYRECVLAAHQSGYRFQMRSKEFQRLLHNKQQQNARQIDREETKHTHTHTQTFETTTKRLRIWISLWD